MSWASILAQALHKVAQSAAHIERLLTLSIRFLFTIVTHSLCLATLPLVFDTYDENGTEKANQTQGDDVET